MDQQNPNAPRAPQSISEISHLFLSNLREKQTDGQARPVRIPPPQRNGQPADPIEVPAPPTPPVPSIDLTPEEYAQVFDGGPTEHATAADHEAVRIPPITAVIAQHLNGRAAERVKEYARHLAANGERIGLLEIDGGEVRLMCFERSIEPNTEDPDAAQLTEHFDARLMTESLDEMSWDLDRWLLVLPNLRGSEARNLLMAVDHWALLSTCDHDGVVSCYRTLKGLAGVHRPHTPRLTLALMETTSQTQAAKVHKKLGGVCLQFLGIELQSESAVRPTRAVAEHLVWHCRTARDKAQLAAGAQWLVATDFLAKAKAQRTEPTPIETTAEVADTEPTQGETPSIEDRHPIAAPAPAAQPRPTFETSVAVSPVADSPVMNAAVAPHPAIGAPALESPASATPTLPEVLDLPAGDHADHAADEESVLSAILAGARGDLIECPVRAPMCPTARLAVTRDRGLVILAVARKGLAELRSIAAAYRWLVENRALIGMAVPQLAIDGHRHPRLRLLVDHADLSAEALTPMLEVTTVTVQAYRKLRWGNKTGLLLEAA